MSFFQELPSDELPAWWQQRFPEHAPAVYPQRDHRDMMNWKMELHDAPLLEWIYKTRQPARHLEFGTWQGYGTRLCLQSCAATVWTLNLWEGESKEDGSWAYGERFEQNPVEGIVVESESFDTAGGKDTYFRTDALGFIGRFYREAGLSHRVCQVYCDTRKWDTSNYPADFFDTVLIDGGHTPEIVQNDTRKALQVTAPGALVMWHDFCPLPEVRAAFSTPHGVYEGLVANQKLLEESFSELIWVNPSWLLLGVRK